MKIKVNDNRTYLSKMTRDEVAELIQYPSELWSILYEVVARYNDEYVDDLAKWILGKDYQKWTKFDSTSYDWWMNIKEGHYADMLGVTDYDYLSDDDAKELKKLQKKITIIKDKVDNLEDCEDYYDKLNEWEDEADKLADQALQIVVKELKEQEEVTDEQILDEFMDGEWGMNYYIKNDDKSVVYNDITRSYKTNIRKDK